MTVPGAGSSSIRCGGRRESACQQRRRGLRCCSGRHLLIDGVSALLEASQLLHQGRRPVNAPAGREPGLRRLPKRVVERSEDAAPAI